MPYQLKLFDLFKKSRINSYYNFFKPFTLQNREFIINYQNQKLKEQINHFYNESPYFKRILDREGVTPNQIKTREDLKSISPLTREDLKNSLDEMTCKKHKRNAHYSTSSGTTGLPVKYAKDVNGYSAGVAAGYILWEMAGWKLSYRQLHIWGNPTSVGKWNKPWSKMKSFIYNKKNIDSTLTNTPAGLAQVVKIIKKFKPQSIDGYTSALLNIATYIIQNNIKIIKAKIVITTAENLLPAQKEIIETALGPVADLYGCGEINGIAIKSPLDNKFIIFNPHVIVETETIENSELKEILITDLDNKLIPMIRYKVGDLIDEVKPPEKDDSYPFEYFTKVNGRQVDLIYLENGKIISPINLLAGTLFRSIGGILKHKVIWENNILFFNFVIDRGFNHKIAQQKIFEYLKNYDVNFKIVIVDKILPDSTGKFKYFEKK